MLQLTQLAGHRFQQVYDTGVTYLISFECERTLRWEVVSGPNAGQSAIELYDSVQIAPNIYFITWSEEDGTVISQVADYSQMIVYTSLACDGNRILLRGTLH
jgi:phenolic acid decarboxylase